MDEVYKLAPIRVVGDIPVFSDTDFYVENYDKISGDHLKILEEDGRNPFMGESHWLEVEDSTEKLVNKYLKPDGKILDVGVGLGRLLGRIQNAERYGMDISLGYLNKTKEKGIDVCMAKVEDMPYVENQFDLVVSTDVLEHVIDENLALKKMLSVIKPGGILVIRVPYKENLKPYTLEEYPYHLAHLRTFDEWSLHLLLNKIFGCEPLEHTVSGYISGPIKPAILSSKILCYLTARIERFLAKTKNARWIMKASKCRRNPAEINFVVKKRR